MASGTCVAGPCIGRNLQSIAVSIEHGQVVLDADPDVLARQFA